MTERAMRVSEVPEPDSRVQVEASHSDDEVTIAVAGLLDRRSGRRLLETAGSVCVNGGSRLTVDLRNIADFTEDGVKAATACRRLCAELPNGVSFLASAGASRRALLAILDHA